LDDKQKDLEELGEERTKPRRHPKGQDATRRRVREDGVLGRYGNAAAGAETFAGTPLHVKGDAGAARFELLGNSTPVSV